MLHLYKYDPYIFTICILCLINMECKTSQSQINCHGTNLSMIDVTLWSWIGLTDIVGNLTIQILLSMKCVSFRGGCLTLISYKSSTLRTKYNCTQNIIIIKSLIFYCHCSIVQVIQLFFEIQENVWRIMDRSYTCRLFTSCM